MAKATIQLNITLSLEEHAQLEAIVRAYGLRSRAQLIRQWIKASALKPTKQEDTK